MHDDSVEKTPKSQPSLKKLWAIFSARERRNALLVMSFAMLAAIFEVLGIVSILPFLSVMTDPQIIHKNDYLRLMFHMLGFTTGHHFLIFLAVATFTVIVTAATVRAVSYYSLTRFAQMRRHTIGLRLLEAYLRQPYEFFLNRHSGDLAKTILSEIDFIIGTFMNPLVNIVTHSLTLCTIVILLLLMDPVVVLVSGVVFCSSYVLLYRKVSRHIGQMGKERAALNQQRFQIVTEAVGGIKGYKLSGQEHTALRRFEQPSHELSRFMTRSTVIGQLPRFAIEAIAFGGILLLSLVLLTRYGGAEANALEKVIPMLGVFAFAGYRMLPAIQGVYQSMAQYRFGGEAVDQVYHDLMAAKHLPHLPQQATRPLPLEKTIRLEAICYRYPNAPKDSIHHLTLTLRKGQLIGVVGTTGAGKTTLVDILLGLLRPQSGQMQIDDQPLDDDNLRAWQANIGYVPQDIFLTDNSIRENIAFGVPDSLIDDEKVQRAAQMAQIDAFIRSDLPNGYRTSVGERGVRLSGGQRQRIGIARALYHNPEVIVFDEATSALDNLTEKEVMDAINHLSGTKTIILIAHRLSTVKSCDRILVLKAGKLAAEGSYESLAQSDPTFQSLLQH
jgi:ABC-type multidrug transport system fused ATPase/permease subunit